MDYYLTVRKEDIIPFVTTWIDLEHMLLREVSQTE